MSSKSSIVAPMVSPMRLTVVVITIVAVWQTVAMWLWVSFPSWDYIMLRVSLSFADAIALAALALSLYTYSELYSLRLEYGTFDTDLIREKKRQEVEKAGDDLDAMEEPRVKVDLRKYNHLQGDESGSGWYTEDEFKRIREQLQSASSMRVSKAANGGKEEA